jgi:hypothetical protein
MLSLFDGGASEADAYALRTPAVFFDSGLVLQEKYHIHSTFQKRKRKKKTDDVSSMCVEIARRMFRSFHVR